MAESWDEVVAPAISKRFMLINRRAPHGTVYALEAVEVALVGGAFAQDVSVVFLDDGVFQLRKGQDTSQAEMKNFSPTYGALEHYDVDKIYVEQESMHERGLTQRDLIVPVRVLDRSELTELMEQQDVILNF
ncbi:MAG: sulfurtransferase complex subunit TusC [Acidiferrobacterales bacterium]